MITRLLKSEIESRLETGKAIILLGPRQVGKTTLIEDILKDKAGVLSVQLSSAQHLLTVTQIM